MYLVICANNTALEEGISEYVCRIYPEKMINLSYVLISDNHVSKCANNPASKALVSKSFLGISAHVCRIFSISTKTA